MNPIKLVLALIALSFFSCKSEEKPPNIIFIMSDDHAQKAISAYSKNLIETPNIDRIAKEGAIFTESYVTNSICAPSRAAMLTSKYSSQNGLRDNRDKFDGSQQTFPKILRKNGYQTCIIGKWHLKTEPTGFDNWRILIGQGQYYNPDFWEMGDTNRYIGYTTDIITNFAVEELEDRDKDKPFAMLIHHKAPHRNWMPNPKYFGAFDSLDIPLPTTFWDDYSSRFQASEADMRIDDMYISFDLKLQKESYNIETGSGGNSTFVNKVEKNWESTYGRLTDDQKRIWDDYYDKINEEFRLAELSGDKLLKWKYRRYINDYLSCILSVDESVGKILDYLDVNDLSENTIVVYTSDQGFYLGEHGWYDKRWMYEESFRTPLLIRYPGKIKPGLKIDEFVMNIDYAPTFFEYAKIDIPNDFQGESFKNLLDGKSTNWRNSIYYHYYEYPHGWHKVRQHYGIKKGSYKLIYFYEIDKWELFVLKNDPNEVSNIYLSMDSSKIVKELKYELDSLRIKYGEIN